MLQYKKKKRIKISYMFQYLIMLLFMFVQLRTASYNNNNFIMRFITNNLNVLYIISTFIVLVIAMTYYIRSHCMSIITFKLFILNLYILIITFYNNGLTGYRSLVRNIIFIVLMDILIEKQKINWIKIMSLTLNTMITINVLNIMIRKVSYFQNIQWYYYGSETYFLGLDNGFIIYILPALILGVFSIKKGGNFFLHFIPPLLGVLSIIYLNVVTSLFCLFFLIIFFICLHKFHFNILNTILLVNFIPFIIFVIFRYDSIITSLFASDTYKISTFLARTEIWEKAKSYIQLNPFIGYGYNLLRNADWLGVGACHNQILDMLLQGGVGSVILYFNIILSTVRGLTNIHNHEAYLFISMLLGMGVAMNFESYSSYSGYSLFLMSLLLLAKYKKLNPIENNIDKCKGAKNAF